MSTRSAAVAMTGMLAIAACDNGSPEAVDQVQPSADSTAAGSCHVTEPSDQASPLPPMFVEASMTTEWFGNRSLWAAVPGHKWFGQIDDDGSVWMKIGWWRLAEGQLRLTAERLDGDGGAIADVPSGYGPTGLQATGLTFSTAGCWRVIGTLGADTISFVLYAGE